MATRSVSGICWRGVKRPSLRLQLAALLVLAGASGPAWAQAPDPRLVASPGHVDPNDPTWETLPVWETAIAAGVDKVMSVYRVGVFNSSDDIGYAIATQVEHQPPGEGAGPPIPGPWGWVEEGLVPFDQDFDHAADPCVAYDRVTGNFVLSGQTTGAPCGWAPTFAIWDASLESFDPGWRRVTLGDDPNQLPPTGDKPWIVAGDVIDDGQEQYQEFYICYYGMGALAYVRSLDGGHTWYGGEITVDGQTIPGGFVQQAAAPDGALYLAYRWDAKFRFLRGEDVNDPNDPDFPMTWDYLYAAPNEPLEVDCNVVSVAKYLPMFPGEWCRAPLLPQLGAAPKQDPNDPDVLYVVYHDTVESDPPDPGDPNNWPCDVDVDVYLNKLTGVMGVWTPGQRVRVNDDGYHWTSDQFHPALTVDGDGDIHVIFYDDRNFRDQIDRDPNGWWPDEPKFDAFYAYSTDGGLNFTNAELYQVPPETAVDYKLVDPNSDFGLADYIGIAHRVQGNGYRIWTSFMGTHAADPTAHKSVIYSSQIPWPE